MKEHLAEKKTKNRIAMPFGKMEFLYAKQLRVCHTCQLRIKVKTNDISLIEDRERTKIRFQVVNADILGPIVPKSPRVISMAYVSLTILIAAGMK
ncbi:hypothetical protein CDAR_605361 [Caerostris darwini]|uniref:Uncharacterized protein n=1 Tax=Caerostris darwini TaxID=1538125 RepID=A0AAV4QTX6_9ARAC|nr:hypothetical protein CDAR_605361 [Caerostris darwini]